MAVESDENVTSKKSGHESIDVALQRLAVSTSLIVELKGMISTALGHCDQGQFADARSLFDIINLSLQNFGSLERVERTRSLDIQLSEDINRLRGKFPTLSSSEIRIAALLRLGFSTRQVALTLYCSERTVDSHRRNIRSKLLLRKDVCLTRFFQDSIVGSCSAICFNQLNCPQHFKRPLENEVLTIER